MLKLVAPPTIEPVTLEEAKSRLRIDGNDSDAMLSQLIREAREYCEDYCRISIMTQTWDVVYDRLPASAYRYGVLYLPRPPVQSITAVYGIDSGQENTINPSYYNPDVSADPMGDPVPCRVFLKPEFPSYPGYRFRFVAGYTQPERVPGGIKNAIIRIVETMYSNPGDIVTGTSTSIISFNAEKILQRYRVYL